MPDERKTIALAKDLTDRGDLTGVVISNEVVEEASAVQALFSGAVFRECTFKRCNFSRADFEGTVFEGCHFDACDFSIADFRSVEAVRTRFSDCNFDGGSMRSCRYVQCALEGCSLRAYSFEENSLLESRFVQCSFEKSTLIHCDFARTVFDETHLADCTAQFHLFSECQFRGSKLNAEAIGLTFGLTRENLSTAGLVWRGLGIETHVDSDDLALDLYTTYEARGWRFGAAILRLNFNLVPIYQALSEIFVALAKEAESTLPVKVDEIWFLSRVVQRLSTQAQLPFISIAQGLDIVITCADYQERKNEEAFRPLYHSLKEAEYTELIAIEKAVSPLHSLPGTSTATAKFVFVKQPTDSFFNWLSELHSNGSLPGLAPRLVGAFSGSYVEVLYLSVATLSSALICLGLIERILDKLVYIRARGAILGAPTLPPVVRRRALQPVANTPHQVLREIRGYLDRLSDNPRLVSEARKFTEQLTQVEVTTDTDASSGETIVEAS